MKLRIISDLHLEFDPEWTLEHFGEDVILCAGDLGSCRARALTEKIIRSSRVPFYYVLGNHDFYGGEVNDVTDYYRDLGRSLKHFHFLHNTTKQLGDYVLAGTPLWTDFALYGPDTVEAGMTIAEKGINDFRGSIKLRDPKVTADDAHLPDLRPRDLVAWNRDARRFLEKTKAAGKPMIVMTHWLPSAETIDPCYAGEKGNAYFATECQDFMGGNVALWVHGHSHIADDRVINGTRVLRNPKGYPREYSNWTEGLIIEI